MDQAYNGKKTMKNTKTVAERRDFLKAAGAGIATASLVHSVHANKFGDASTPIRVALIGCGGRGSGAAMQSLNADQNTRLVAMADLFEDRLNGALQRFQKQKGDRVDVPPARQFIGFDAYKKVMELDDVDLVILTTPPHFRPQQFEAAVAAGKHIFCEKPMAVDAGGVRRVLAAAKKAREHNTLVVSGFCWRFDHPKRALFERVLNGEIGDVVSVYNTYNSGPTWSKKQADGQSDLEWQLRDWPQHVWLSGDHIVEQAVHSIDMMSWAFGDEKPVKVTGHGGRQVYNTPEMGNCYDHFAVVYEYESGRKGFHFSRKINGCSKSYDCFIQGTTGRAEAMGAKLFGADTRWRYEGAKPNMYQVEHNEICANLRKGGEMMNQGDWMCNSTLLAIMGRMATYTGQTLEYDQVLNSKTELTPTHYDFNKPLPIGEVAKPGLTRFV